MPRHALTALGAAACVALSGGSANAFTIQTPITRGCHEEITAEALRRTRAALPDVAGALRSQGEDEALIADAPFDVPP